ESQRKSDTLGPVWREKKAKARADRSVQTTQVPGWLEVVGRRRVGHLVVGGEFRVIPEKKAVVNRVFDLAVLGHGSRAIVRELNREGVPALRRSGVWSWGAVAALLNNRAVLGEYQPHKGRGSRKLRKPDGPPIPEFFPAIVTPERFEAARAAVVARRGKG